MKIKVCGLRNKENILDLYDVGVRMMGFIFYEKSKRYINSSKRREIFDAIPFDVKKVGVFVNESLEFVLDTISSYGLDYAQLHGDEDAKFCESVGQKTKVIKAFRIDEEFDFDQLVSFQECELLLFDAKGKDYGGNGIKYDWSLLHNYQLETPFLLSGGIKPDDIDKILSFEHPKFIGIDINSGFEIEAGLKDVQKIKSFISYLRCSTQ